MPCTKVCTWPYKSVWFVFRCGTVLLVYLRRLIDEQSNSVCIGDYIHILKNRFYLMILTKVCIIMKGSKLLNCTANTAINDH